MDTLSDNGEREIPEGFIRIEENTLLEQAEATIGRITKYYSRNDGDQYAEVHQTQWTREEADVYVNIEDCVNHEVPLDQAIFTTFDIFHPDDAEPSEGRVKRLVIRNIEWGGDLKVAAVMEADGLMYDSPHHSGYETRFFQKTKLRIPTLEEIVEFSTLASTIEADLQRVEREGRLGYGIGRIASQAITNTQQS